MARYWLNKICFKGILFLLFYLALPYSNVMTWVLCSGCSSRVYQYANQNVTLHANTQLGRKLKLWRASMFANISADLHNNYCWTQHNFWLPTPSTNWLAATPHDEYIWLLALSSIQAPCCSLFIARNKRQTPPLKGSILNFLIRLVYSQKIYYLQNLSACNIIMSVAWKEDLQTKLQTPVK